jgi:hypothetical protein
MTADTNLRTYHDIDFTNMPMIVATLVQALIPFAEMDRPGDLKESGPGSEESLRKALNEVVLSRGTSSDNTVLTNRDFRAAARALFELTGTVPGSYWSYGQPFGKDIVTINEQLRAANEQLQADLEVAKEERDRAIQGANKSAPNTSPNCAG